MTEQQPLWQPKCDWRPPALSDLPNWKGAKRVSIDSETRDRNLKQLGIGVRRGAYMVGVSFAIEDGPQHYLPMRHEGGDNLPPEQVEAYLREQAREFDGEVVGMNLGYDLDYMWEQDILFPNIKRYLDVQVVDPLIYELHKQYSLNAICERHGVPGKDEATLREAASAFGVDPKSGMWRLPARYVGEYAEGDADRPLKVLRRQERLIDEHDLWDIYNLEAEVLPVLIKMRRRGVRINQDKLAEIEDWSLREEAEALAKIRHLTGVNIAVGDVWKAGALAPALEAIGITLERTSTGQPSIRKDMLDDIDHPVAKAMHRARKVNKMRTTFAASIRQHMVNGRIHCTFNQIARETEKGDMKGARYGRLSATDPNMQQQPNPEKDPELAGEWRKIYLPEEGAEWATCDYSQQEPRWTTHFAAVMDLEGAREAAKAYHDNPDLDNHQFMADLTGLKRTYAKNVYLGLCYGEGGAKLCDDLGLPTRWALGLGRGRSRRVIFFDTHAEAMARRKEEGEGFAWRAAGEEGQEILDTFDARAPFIRQAAKAAQQVAQRRGYVITGGGRHLHFPQREDGSYDWTHKAFNRVIQGTSADQTKRAMVEIDKAGHWMMLQVHDEIDPSVADRAEAEAVAKIMREVMPAEVPFKVDVEIGPSWGEAE